jgi:hypothetical protein
VTHGAISANGGDVLGEIRRRFRFIAAVVTAVTFAACAGGDPATPRAVPRSRAAVTSVRVASAGPNAGPSAGGAAVAIAGSGFLPGATVLFGDAPAFQVTVAKPTDIIAIAPAHAGGTVDVTVLNPDGGIGTLAAGFRFIESPQVASVSPGQVLTDGGATIIVRGSGFAPGARVRLSNVNAVTQSWVAADQLVVVVPPHAAGAVDVLVQNPDGQTSTLPAALAYVTALPPPPPPPPVAAPAIASVQPASGPTSGGTAVTIAGASFGSAPSVTFGGAPATLVTASPTSLSVIAPPGAAGAADVAVVNPDGRSATLAAAFTYVAPPAPAPAVAAVVPASGASTGGDVVTLSGTGFAPGATVAFGGVQGVVSAVAPGAITVATPAHAAGAIDVVVANPDGQSATIPAGFTFVAPPPPPPPPPPPAPAPAPTLAAIAPAAGADAGGDAITLTGAGFAPGATVTLGGIPAAVVSVSATAIAAVTPAHAAGAVDVTVTNPDGQAATLAAAFVFLAPPPPPPPPAPSIASVTPSSGPDAGGATVVITGAAFAAGATVDLGGALATVTGVAAGSITLVTAAHAAGAVDVTVTNPDGQLAVLPLGFSFVAPAPPPPPPSPPPPVLAPAPVLAALSPATGFVAGGDVVSLTGTNFAAGVTVSFGGVAAPVAGTSSTLLTVVTPAQVVGVVDVTVTNPDGQSSTLAGAFTFVPPPPPPPPAPPPSAPAPVALTIAPVSGTTAGGDVVVITGTTFDPAVTVDFGGSFFGVVTSATSTSITVTTPPHPIGVVDVIVANPDGQASLLPAAFTFAAPPAKPPKLLSISPATDTAAGGLTVTLSGGDFAPGATVSFGATAGTVLGVSLKTIFATVPAHAPGLVDVTVTNPDGQSATLPASFVYTPVPAVTPAPTLSSVLASSGPVVGGTVISVTGTNFVAGATVLFGGVAGTIQSLAATSIIVATPPHTGGFVDVTVRNPDGQSATLASAFRYIAPGPNITTLNIHGTPMAGGTTVLIAGSGFQPGARVTFGGVAALSVTLDTVINVLNVTAPPGPGGVEAFVDVTVTNPDGQFATIAGFHYGPPPQVLSFASAADGTQTLNNGKAGQLVNINGVNFSDVRGLQVSFSGNLATVTAKSPTALTVGIPKLNPGSYQVIVTNFDGQFGVAPGFLTVLGP